MQDNQIAKYPDYLLEFEEIAALAAWQKLAIKSINDSVNPMMNDLKLRSSSHPEWEEIFSNVTAINATKMRLLHRKYPVTTWEILKDYIRVWLSETDASLEYDKKNFTVKVRVAQSKDTPWVRKWTRDILPCNLNLEFVVGEVA